MEPQDSIAGLHLFMWLTWLNDKVSDLDADYKSKCMFLGICKLPNTLIIASIMQCGKIWATNANRY